MRRRMCPQFPQCLRRSTLQCRVKENGFFMCVVCERKESRRNGRDVGSLKEIESGFYRVIPLFSKTLKDQGTK